MIIIPAFDVLVMLDFMSLIFTLNQKYKIKTEFSTSMSSSPHIPAEAISFLAFKFESEYPQQIFRGINLSIRTN